MRHAPQVQPLRRSLECHDAVAQFDPRIELTVLGVPVGTGHSADDHRRIVGGVPLDIERNGDTLAERAPQRDRGVVEEHTVCLVAQTPLPMGDVAAVIGPHLGRLDLEPTAQTARVELLDVEIGLAGPHQTRPVVEAPAVQLETDEPPCRCIGGRAPPPPALDDAVRMAVLVDVRSGWHNGQTMGVIRYLSLDWLDVLTSSVADDTTLQHLAAEHEIGVTQVVTGGPEGDVTYHLQVGGGRASFGAGAADPEHVRMQQTWDTAVGVATGTLNAQSAFIEGRILLTGDQQRLMAAQPVFGALDAVFRTVREQTEYR